MAVRATPIFIDGNSHPAEETRLMYASMMGASTGAFTGGVGARDSAHGVANDVDLAVTQNGTPNMSVNVAAGGAFVRNGQSANGGVYHLWNDGTLNLAVSAADATNPRRDLVIATIRDNFYGGGGFRDGRIIVVTGTPAASPSDPSLSAYPNALVLARIAVGPGVTSITTANITDLRTRAAALGGVYVGPSTARPTVPMVGEVMWETDNERLVGYSASNGWVAPGAGQTFRNAVMNGDFRVNQRALGSGGTTTSGTYGFDRWQMNAVGGTVTYSSQAFTVGTYPTSGYDARNFARLVTASQTVGSATHVAWMRQYIEDVRNFNNSTVTVSFWAKADSGTPKVAVELVQDFGLTSGSKTGVSSDVQVYAGQVTLSTTWTRYSLTVAVPSISTKTIGSDANTSSLILNIYTSAGSNFNARTGSLGVQNFTFDMWGVQLERGPVATPFEQRPFGLELQLVQRYYVRKVAGTGGGHIGDGWSYITTQANIYVPLQVPMRVVPTALDNGGSIFVQQFSNNTYAISALSLLAGECSNTHAALSVTHAAGSANIGALMRANNDATGYVGFSAEF